MSEFVDGIVAPQPARLTPVTDWHRVEPLLARYDLLGEVGRGGMGVVYKAVDRETGETVALKVLAERIAADSAAAERLKNELRLARRVTHRNVCRVHDFNRVGPVAFLTMEFVDGESLRGLLARVQRLPAATAARIARQVCAALDEAHAEGIVHRDLKPENVMLDRSGIVKVLDFGIARLAETEAATTLGGLVGTPAYMAPEQAAGRPVDGRADLYALGLILYEMLVGRAAFTAATPLAVALKQLHETPPPPSAAAADVPATLDVVVLRCLEKDPARRWPSAAALGEALAEAVPDARLTPPARPTPARPAASGSGEATVAGTGAHRGRRRARWATAAVLFVAAAAVSWQIAGRYRVPRGATLAIPMRQTTLANGLRVVVSEDPRTSTVTVAVGYRAGSSVEEPGLTGLAHLFEHLMFQGSERVGAGEHLALASVYGETNGFTDADYTLFFERLPANQLELALFLEADRMRSLALDERRFGAERQVVIEERRQVIDNAPFGRASELLFAAAYDRFPYWHAAYGSVDDLSRATLEDARSFYRRFFSPANAVLAIVGDIDADRTLALVAKYFGDIPSRSHPGPLDLTEPERLAERRVAATDPFVSTSNVYVAFLGPSGDSEDWYALAALSCILGQGGAARLHQKLVREAEVASFVTSTIVPRRGPSLLLIAAGARPAADVAAIERTILAELERIETEGVTRDELDRARRQMQRERAEQFQTTRGRAVAIVDAALRFGDASLVNEVDRRYAAITPESVRAAVRRYLTESRRTVLVIGPEPGGPRLRPRGGAAGERPPSREAPLDTERKGLAPISSTSVAVRFPRAVEVAFDNGLTLLVVEDHRVPLVAGQIGVRGAGALFEPRDLAGLAHATARMLPEGTRTHTGRQIAELLEGAGASLGVSAPFGSAAATLTCSGLSSTFDTWFPVVIEVLREPVFPPDALNALKQQLKSSIATSRARATFAARTALGQLVFGDHPAAVSLPTLDAIDALTSQRLAEWHRTRYVPQHTLVTIAGDVDARRVAATVRSLLGGWPRTEHAVALPPDPLPAAERTVAVVDRPGSAQAALAVGNLGVARADADYAAVAVANRVLGEGPASRLFRLLRGRGDAYSVASTFAALGYPGLWSIQAEVRPDAVGRSTRAILEELRRLRDEPVPPPELREGQTALVAAFALSLEELDRVVSYAATRKLYGFSPDYWDTYPAKITGVSAADVARVARTYLNPDAVQIVVVGGGDLARAALAPLGPVAAPDLDAPRTRVASPPTRRR